MLLHDPFGVHPMEECGEILVTGETFLKTVSPG